MNDPNDSDGSWEFVDKDSDSETSSVASPYDTGLPDELSTQETNEDEAGAAWMNNEEFITDSDIEACAEETADSDVDEATPEQVPDEKLDQEERENSGPDLHEENREEEKDEGQGRTRSMLLYDEEVSTELPKDAEANAALDVEDAQETIAASASGEVKDDASSPESAPVDDITHQEVAEEEASHTSERADEDIPDHAGEAEAAREDESLDAGFEKLDVTSQESTEILSVSSTSESLESLNAVEQPKAKPLVGTVDQEVESGSDSGSGDFTVISAPSNPPVEILSQRTETRFSVEDDTRPLKDSDGSRSGEKTPANHNAIDMAARVVASNQRTIGVVTDHLAPPNRRLVVSLIMISFGVGYMLGRCPIRYSPTLLQVSPEPHNTRAAGSDVIQFVYHGQKQPLWEADLVDPHFEDALRAMKEKQDSYKAQLAEERSKVKLRNRGLRQTIQQLKEENNKILLESMERSKDLEASSLAFNLLKQSCHRKERMQDVEAVKKSKEIQDLKARLFTMERDAAFQNQTVTLYKRLQEQHEKLTALYRAAAAQQESKDAKNAERQLFLLSRLHQLRRDLRDLRFSIWRSNFEKAVLKERIQQLESDAALSSRPADLSEPYSSPLMRALAEHGQTCPSDARYRTQTQRLRSRVRVQRLRLQKMADDNELKSRALEVLYGHVGELTSSVMCLQQQLRMPLRDRAKDPIAFCRSAYKMTDRQNTVSSRAKSPPLPQCGLQVNGTLAFDLTTFNLTVKLDESRFSSYALQVFKPPLTRDIYFNATCIYRDFIDRRHGEKLTPDPTCQLHERPTSPHQDFSGPNRDAALLPAVLYHFSEASNVRARSQIEKQKTRLAQLQKVCKARGRALNATRAETKRVKTDLAVVRKELISLRSESKDLRKKLANVSRELQKKPSLKQCFTSALDTDAIVRKINGTKTFKAAQKMASKVKDVTHKAWRKFTKFMNKYGSNSSHHERHQDDRDWKHHHKPRHQREQKHHHGWRNRHEAVNHHHDLPPAHEANDKRERLRNQPVKSRNQPRSETHDPTWQKQNLKSNKNKVKPPTTYPNYRMKMQNKKEENAHDARQNKKERAKDNHGKVQWKQGQNKEQNEEKTRRFPKYEKEQRKKGEDSGRKDRKRHHFQQHETPKFQRKDNDRKEHESYASTARRHFRESGRRAQRNEFKKRHHFRDVVSSVINRHIQQAKRAGKKVFNQLMPIYDIWKNTYCTKEEKFLPESFNKIWCSAEDGNEQSKNDYLSGEGVYGVEWLALYRNFTEFLSPILPWRDEVIENPVTHDEDDVTPSWSHEEGFDEGSLKANERKDPLWFTKMFKARESMRKDWKDMKPLSEDEFDWFLKMFEFREQLRKNGEDSYPGERLTNADWFLKMFEARARIRFQHAEDDDRDKNWFLKMSEARNQARCQGSRGKGDADLYENLFHGREEIRKNEGGSDWYHDMAAARAKARKELYGTAGTEVPSEGWCQA